ncbi:ABC transporter ATP-binding protein [Hansschlegelia sp. KR7-227]|uniref:ABC transporter ATP-binding protein n=1 Tax=Hansschlegelia sp. KR7-227 TaxID=3400914 RepID=UPI003C0F4E4B
MTAPALKPVPQPASRGAISIRNVVKTYGSGASQVTAVDDCSFEVAAGEICMVVGPSGCGKTSLLNAIAGFHDITAGEIVIDGERICGPDRPMAEPGPDRVVVFQNGALFPWKTNLENVAFGPTMQGTMTEAAAKARARDMLAEVGLDDVAERFPGEISSGMRRRVEIARALINEPRVLLLDEPYRALDALTKQVMHEALLEVYYRNKVTIFFITHDLEEAVFLGHKLVISTARPCRPKTIIEVDIPHPRDRSVITSPRFRELMEATHEAVRQEAVAAFQAGDKEG